MGVAGGLWRTSGLLSESSHLPHPSSRVPPTHTPGQPLAPSPISHPSFRGSFSHTFWALRSICFIFEGIQELLSHTSHPSPVTALGLNSQAPGSTQTLATVPSACRPTPVPRGGPAWSKCFTPHSAAPHPPLTPASCVHTSIATGLSHVYSSCLISFPTRPGSVKAGRPEARPGLPRKCGRWRLGKGKAGSSGGQSRWVAAVWAPGRRLGRECAAQEHWGQILFLPLSS